MNHSPSKNGKAPLPTPFDGETRKMFLQTDAARKAEETNRLKKLEQEAYGQISAGEDLDLSPPPGQEQMIQAGGEISRGDIDFAQIPPRPGPEIYFLRLKGKDCHTFTVIAKSVMGINVHYCDRSKRSSPHYRNPMNCPGCRSKVPKRWKGFLHCFDHNLSQQVFLELTPRSAIALQELLPKVKNLRGNRLQVKRTPADNGRLLISALTAVEDPEKLPDERDPYPCLMKLWGLYDLLEEADRGGQVRDFE